MLKQLKNAKKMLSVNVKRIKCDNCNQEHFLELEVNVVVDKELENELIEYAKKITCELTDDE